MPARSSYDAVVVGSGPNGLAAAIEIARAGRSVVVFEAAGTLGGGMRSAEITLPGFLHDVCAAILPLAAGSPFFRSLPLREFGLEWVFPPAALAHPFEDGTAIVLERSLAATAATLGQDGPAYQRLMAPLVRAWDGLMSDILGPLRIPRHPLSLARFGLHGLRSAQGLARHAFRTDRARAFFAGLAAHAILPLDTYGTAAFGLVMAGSGHAVGWPLARGGTRCLADALAAYLRSLGGETVTGYAVDTLESLPPARAILLDVTPHQLIRIAGNRLSARYRRQLARYRYGPGVFKIDWALDSPIPWAANVCARAGTVHLGGSFAEIAESERAAWQGRQSAQPYVIVVQPTLFDPSRAPEGKHTAWAYCHVPSGSALDRTDQIEQQIERFAPGFRARILARHRMTAADMELYNPNYVGGDINGGIQDLRQLFTRPVVTLTPYATSDPAMFICSSSTPPGGGVHGMCGYYAARAALRRALA